MQALELTGPSGGLPEWLVRTALPESPVRAWARRGWRALWWAAAVLAAFADLATMHAVRADLIAAVLIVAAAWVLDDVGVAGVLLVLVAVEPIAFARGDIGIAGLAARLVLLALVAFATRVAAMGAAEIRRGRQAEQAIEAVEEIGSSDDLTEVVERVLRHAVAVVSADRGSISRIEGGVMVLEHEHDPGHDPSRPGLRWRLSDNALAADAVQRQTSLRGAPPVESSFIPMRRWLEQTGLRHSIQCPLLVDREVVGLLGLSRRRDERFTDADLEALRPFAALAGMLLKNARLLDEARQEGQAKSDFLSVAAHELRAPLAVIKGYLSLLEDGTYPVPDRTREEAVDTLVAKAQELESLIEALLTTARLDAGTHPLATSELDLRQAVREAVSRIRPRARLEGARIEQRLPVGEARTRADSGHVGRILDNLLNNALSYSARPASVTVELRAGAAPRALEVAVRDHGCGIAAEERESVFERFNRLDGGLGRRSPGLGLGLSISRELAQLNGGSLFVEASAPGQGSVFVLRLPTGPRS